MDIGSKLVSLARRSLPVSREFDSLIRGIGECKSKGEEDIIVARIIEITKALAKEPPKDLRTVKELLVYLIYTEMLGHDTAWAQATIIQLCSHKNLVVKKVRG
jgi:AP-4 complex subunit epsilon-1